MGDERICRMDVDGADAVEVRVQLESDELILRGAARRKIPLSTVQAARAHAGVLTIDHGHERLVLHLGDQAARWCQRILHPPSRVDKLGIKPNLMVRCHGLDDASFEADLRAAGVARVEGAADLIFVAVACEADLSRLSELARSLRPRGALWVLRPRGSTAVSEAAVLAAGRATGLRDVKVVRFSETLTAHKFTPPGVEKRP